MMVLGRRSPGTPRLLMGRPSICVTTKRAVAIRGVGETMSEDSSGSSCRVSNQIMRRFLPEPSPMGHLVVSPSSSLSAASRAIPEAPEGRCGPNRRGLRSRPGVTANRTTSSGPLPLSAWSTRPGATAKDRLVRDPRRGRPRRRHQGLLRAAWVEQDEGSQEGQVCRLRL